MDMLLLVYLAIQQATVCLAQSITVTAGEDVTFSCTSKTAYPAWNGPELYNGNVIAYNNPGNSNFANPYIPQQKKARLDWGSDNKGLIIKDVAVTDEGLYQCSDGKTLFVRVPPRTPLILNTESSSDNTSIIRASQAMETKLVCVSTGGYPKPQVEWYRGTVTRPLISTSIVIKGNNSYNVTKTYAFSPQRQDDGVKYICQSSFQTEPTHTSASNVGLVLNLQPNQPTVVQTSAVSAGKTVEVLCTTTGSRPAANITWSYRNTNHTGEVTTTLNDTTQTYAVVSLFRRPVTAEDNGQNVQCKVSHKLLVEPPQLIASVKLNVDFSAKALTTTITGNRVIAATGSTPLTLTCTTGSSNPASDIVWKNKSVTISNNRQYNTWTGGNNGIVRSQELELHPTRYMDGDVITCSVSNLLNLQSPINDTATLHLNYSPIVTIKGQQYTFTEGEREVLICKVDCKPKATITWYHGDTPVSQEMPVNKILNYSLEPVNRSHYGYYRCKANNGIGTADEEQISLNIKFKPLTTTISGNNIVIANGRNTLTLTCISGSSNPTSDITWKISTEITLHTGIPALLNGDYGGMKRSKTLTVTPTRHNDGDNISCEANNTIGTSGRSIATLDLQYRPMIRSMSDVVVVEGNKTILTCTASSKPASTFKWYREGQRGILHQGTGTLANNKLAYTIHNVRRTDAATYRCNADNNIERVDNKNVVLTVNYPPDVTLVTTNTSVKNKTAVITCNAKGVPDTNYRYGQWEQRWQGYDVPESKKNGSEKLVLTNLTYEHSGVYTCSASNGIKVFGTDKEFMKGSVHLLVKSFPIITYSSDKTSARLNGNATFEVYYYSNIEGSAVKIYRTVNKSRQKEVIYNVSKSSVDVNLPVFTHTIKTVGTRARVMIQIHSKEDLGFYAVNISNEIDSSTRSFEIVPEGPPSNPYNVTVDILQYNKARLSWIRGYHGGFAQTFVIQMSTDLKNWKIITVSDGKNESEEPISKDLLDLHDSTTYYIQMYAFNTEGNSSSTENLNFTTLSKIEAGRFYME